MNFSRSALLACALLAVALSGCGGNDNATRSGSEAGAPPPRAGDGLQHIHGLGVSANTLLIATHTGLWAAPEGRTKARRVGASRQDVMGFSVLSKGRFIGSGHPGPAQNLPPNLGLIESSNGGKSWKNISLEGQADFHVLVSAGARAYGFDGTKGRLMVSSDSGRTWTQRTPPTPMFSLAVDPDSPEHFVTSTGRGLFESKDAGRSFRALASRQPLVGLLAWSAKTGLFLVDGRGQVRRSPAGGRGWQPVGAIGGQPAAFIAHGGDLYAALADNTVKRSTDRGQSWAVRATP